MYDILKTFNETTFLGMKDGMVYVLKRIFVEDIELYKKLAAVDNPNIAKVYETVRIENDFYAVLEFVQGQTLEEYVKKYGFMDDAQIKNVVLQLCAGLEAVHSCGIVHRDINPSNVMLDENGTVKIIDFGISRIRKADSRTDTHLLGTQGYAPPEQYGFSQTGFESDIYSVGVLMNYLKTGCTVSEKLAQGTLAPVIIKCTQVDKNNRYKNAASLAEDISGKVKLSKIFRSIPGFRQDIWWHKAIALLYYISAVVIIAFAQMENGNTKTDILCKISMFFLTAVPVPLLMNMCGWQEKWSYTRNRSKQSKTFVAVILSGVSWVISIIILLSATK